MISLSKTPRIPLVPKILPQICVIIDKFVFNGMSVAGVAQPGQRRRA